MFYQDFDEAAESSKVQPLNTMNLANNDFELRLWIIPGMGRIYGLRLLRSNGQWERGRIELEPEKHEYYRYRRLAEPQIKWEGLWNILQQEKLTSLHPCEAPSAYPDCAIYMAEIVSMGEYKNYVYIAPDGKNCPDVNKVDRLGDIISAK